MGAGVVRSRARLRVDGAGRMARGCGVGAAGSSAGASLREPARALTRPGAAQAVNRSPLALERRFRDYEDATVDGINDRLVPAGAKAPRWRVSGHVASEEPVSSPQLSPATAAAYGGLAARSPARGGRPCAEGGRARADALFAARRRGRERAAVAQRRRRARAQGPRGDRRRGRPHGCGRECGQLACVSGRGGGSGGRLERNSLYTTPIHATRAGRPRRFCPVALAGLPCHVASP